MARAQQIELAALAAVGKAPGVQVWIQDTESGFRVLLSALVASVGGDATWLRGEQSLEAVGVPANRQSAVYLDKAEWDRALLRALTGAKAGVALHTVPAFTPSCIPQHIEDDATTTKRVGHA